MLFFVIFYTLEKKYLLYCILEYLIEELDLLKNVFISNGYPEHLVVKTLQESWPRETLKAVLKGVQQDVEVENEKEYFEVLHASCVKGFTEGLRGG